MSQIEGFDKLSENKFDYLDVPLSKLVVDIVDINTMSSVDKLDIGGYNIINGRHVINAIIVDGEPIKPSSRFWESFYARFGLNKSFFKFFSITEVFERVSQRSGVERLRICVERAKDRSQLLAVSGFNKPAVIYDDFIDLVQKMGNPKKITYHNGVVLSTHKPNVASAFKIGSDVFSNEFVISAPVDGFGDPNIYLSMLRQVCSNGAIGFAPGFKTALSLGRGDESVRFALKRAFESFSNDEGFAMMRDRFEKAQKSWASVAEQQDVYKLLLQLQGDKLLQESASSLSQATKSDFESGVASGLIKTFHKITGDPYEIYHVDPNVMSSRRQKHLPAQCTVYEMINFITELATHHVSEHNARKLQAWVGELLSHDYDLEGSCDAFDSWRELYFQDLTKPTK